MMQFVGSTNKALQEMKNNSIFRSKICGIDFAMLRYFNGSFENTKYTIGVSNWGTYLGCCQN